MKLERLLPRSMVSTRASESSSWSRTERLAARENSSTSPSSDGQSGRRTLNRRGARKAANSNRDGEDDHQPGNPEPRVKCRAWPVISQPSLRQRRVARGLRLSRRATGVSAEERVRRGRAAAAFAYISSFVVVLR